MIFVSKSCLNVCPKYDKIQFSFRAENIKNCEPYFVATKQTQGAFK